MNLKLSRASLPFFFAVSCLLALSACSISKKTVVKPSEVRPAKDASEKELLAGYNHIVGEISSINAAVQLAPTAGSAYSGVIEEYHQVQGFILAQKPADVRVIGQAPVLAKNIFDMVSDGKTFRIYIPSKNQFIVGPTNLERSAEKPIENLRPQHLLDALFWPSISPEAETLFEEFEQSPNRFYVITLLREKGHPRIDRKLWFDRSDLSLARVDVYDDSGRIISDIQLSDWQPAATSDVASASQVNYPRHILLRRPHDDYQLDIHITKLTLNEKISTDRFTLAQPANTKLTQLGEGKQ
jgi:outer membrane lipoprotein-sorting protein